MRGPWERGQAPLPDHYCDVGALFKPTSSNPGRKDKSLSKSTIVAHSASLTRAAGVSYGNKLDLGELSLEEQFR